ncbi:protein kinase, partial [Corallococcus exercitus]|nr:protein kinase [Corallococcus exercitus]
RQVEPELPPPPKGMSGGMKAAIIGVPLLLIGAGVAVVMTRGGGETTPPPVAMTPPRAPVEAPPARVQEPAATPPPAALPQDVTVEFTSTPSGAAIFDGEAQIGTTPTKLMLPREKASVLRFKLTGHQDQEKTLDYSRLADTSEQHVNVRLDPVRAAPPSRPTKPSKPSGGNDPGIGVFE